MSLQNYFREHDAVLDPLGARVAAIPLDPFIYNQKLVDEINYFAKAYFQLVEFVTQNYDQFRDILRYEDNLDKLLLDCPDYPNNVVLARSDIFLSKKGIKMVETNCDSPGGNEESYHLEKIFATYFPNAINGAKTEHRIDNALEALMISYQQQKQQKGLTDIKDKPRIALIEWEEDIKRIKGELDVFINEARKRGYDCDLITPQSIEFRNNEAYNDNRPIDLIYRRIVLQSLPSHMPDGYDFARRLNDCKTAVVNPLSSKKGSSKQIMVLLTDEIFQDRFPDDLSESLDIVRKVIPKTKSLKFLGEQSEFLKEVQRNRTEYVLKEANSYSSMGVFIGADLTQDEWDFRMKQSLGKDFVVQEKIDLPSMRINMYDQRNHRQISEDLIYNINPYIFLGKFAGFYFRASQDNLTSFKRGLKATVLPCFQQN